MPAQLSSPAQSVEASDRAHAPSTAKPSTAAAAVPSFAHTVLGAPYEPPLSPDDPDWPLHVPATATDAKDQGTVDAW